MKQRTLRALIGVAVTSVALSTLQISAQAVKVQAAKGPVQRAPAEAQAKGSDDLLHPLGEKQRALREKATEQLIKGTAKIETKGGRRVINVGKGRYVQYAVEREESIFTILADFGTRVDPKTFGTAGPLNNEIPAPDRVWDGSATDNNSTYWAPNFNRAHYQDLMFGQGESFRDFYLKQSNGKFLAKGDVSDWVTVPFNEAHYGSNLVKASEGAWPFVRDSATAWYNAQVAAGKTAAEIKAYLSQFDKVDRYDYDHDGIFNEPDGYIDHFQAIHAGEGEEAKGGAQGTDAIWSHRAFAFSTDAGSPAPRATSPAASRSATPACGSVTTPPSQRTGAWVSSPTSSATTSACRTSTTPKVETTAPGSGR